MLAEAVIRFGTAARAGVNQLALLWIYRLISAHGAGGLFMELADRVEISPTETRSAVPLRYGLYLLILVALFPRFDQAFPLDDSFIALSNARQLLTGINPYQSSAMTGATSAIHLGLLALFGTVLPLKVASLLISAVAATLYALGLDVLMRKSGATGWRVPLLVVTGLLGSTSAMQIYNGLETAMAAATVAWMLVLADDRRLPFLAGLAPYVRPELALLAILLIGRQCWRAPWTEALRTIAIAAAVAVPLEMWIFFETGHLVPQTAGAKIAFFAFWNWPVYWRIFVAFKVFAMTGFIVLLPGLLAYRGIGVTRGVFVVGVIAVEIALLPDAFGWNHGRYLVPLMPALLAGIAELSSEKGGSALTALVGAIALAIMPSSVEILRSDQLLTATESMVLPHTLSQVPDGGIVMIHDAGLPAWYAPRLRLIDVAGLKTPSNIEWHRKFTKSECGQGPASAAIARQSGAQYLLSLRYAPWNCIATGMRELGWKVDPLPSTGSGYQLYRLTAPTSAR